MALKNSIRSDVEKKLEEYESRVNHMYLDSEGNVTVGVGHLIANKVVVDLVKMYEITQGNISKVATLKQKQDEFSKVSKQKWNYKAGWYKQFTSLVMKDVDIDAQVDHHIDNFYTELTGLYKKSNGFASDFDSFPEPVQKALFDMIFNLGQTTLRNIFVKFNAAIKKEDWATAAKESKRSKINDERNKYVSDLFLQADKATKTLPSNKILNKVGSKLDLKNSNAIAP